MLFSAFFSRWGLMLSEHLTISECRNLRFPMNSECQFSPDLLSRSNKVTLTDNLDGWQRFDWICHYFNYWREWVRIKCGMLSRWEQSCDTGNDRSSYHCSKNWTVWELDPDSDKWEHWHRKFIELSSCASDHSPDYIVRLSWQLHLRRQAWWDLPCRITWQWTISSWNKTGSSTYIRLFINLRQAPCRWIFLHSKVLGIQFSTIHAWGWMSAINCTKLRHVFRVRDQYKVHSHISVNVIARSRKLFKCQPWLTIEEWRPYLCSCQCNH